MVHSPSFPACSTAPSLMASSASRQLLCCGPALRSHRRALLKSARPCRRRCDRPTVALAFPSSRSQQAETAQSSSSAASSSASAVIERPTETCPYPRPDGYVTDASPFASVDRAFSPEAIDTADGLDASQLRARIAEVSAAQEEGDAGGGADADAEKPAGMDASLKGMLLLNLGAVLFGSNMVSAMFCQVLLKHLAPMSHIKPWHWWPDASRARHCGALEPARVTCLSISTAVSALLRHKSLPSTPNMCANAALDSVLYMASC